MNPYPERIEQLHQHLENEYGQTDRDGTEVLLAALIDPSVTGAARPWIVLETDWLSRDTRTAWFAFGGAAGADVRSLASARVSRPREMQPILNGWLEEGARGAPMLFTDAEWRRLSHYQAGKAHLSTMVSSYQTVLARCIRVRIVQPKGDHAMRPGRDAAMRELKRLTERVLDNQWRDPGAACRADAPQGLLYWCELLQRACLYPADWTDLTAGLAAVCRNVATLYADNRAPNWRTAERIIRDSVNYTTAYIMLQAALGKDIKAWDTYASEGMQLHRIWRGEMKRLLHIGALVRTVGTRGRGTKSYTRYRLGSEVWKTLVDRSERMFAA